MIPFIDLAAQQRRIRSHIEAAVHRVLDHGQYINGPEVKELEEKLAPLAGVKHAISCANGTDALTLGLMALGVKPGEVIFVPGFTFAATAQVVASLGAIPFFVDVSPENYNMSPHSLEAAVLLAKQKGLRAVGIIPVDLFGQPADHPAIEAIAKQNGLWSMVDAAQSFGSLYQGKPAGAWGQLATTSFFPAKPLGCYGEGGAIFTNDDELAHLLFSIRSHGQGDHTYDNVRLGMNGRLETLQAAILLQKLTLFEEELNLRQDIAARYSKALQPHLTIPKINAHAVSSWAQYTVQLPAFINRDHVIHTLKQAGIPTMVYYPRGLHQQPAYVTYPHGDMSVSEALSQRVLSLPMHPYLEEKTQNRIIDALIQAIEVK